MAFVKIVAIAKTKFVLVNVLLKRQCNVGFFGLNDEKRTNLAKECRRFLAGNIPAPLRTVFLVALAVVVAMNASGEVFGKLPNDSFVSHSDHNYDLIANVSAVRFCEPCNSDHAFTVKKSSSVSNFHVYLQVKNENVANSGNIRCPARKGAEGQSRAKQAERLGVCNEHVPQAEAKICSGLGRNVERLAEMTSPFDVSMSYRLHQKVTDRNTDYIFLRYAPKRLFKPLERVQSINQDAMVQLITFAGNMTTSNAARQGVLKA